MARAALLALLSAALLACARATTLPTCPANGATGCFIGLIPSPTGATTAVALPYSQAIIAERLGGLNYSDGTVGVCSTLSFTCNAALASLYAFAGTRSTVQGFAGGACVNNAVTPSVMIVNNVTYTGYGAFSSTECTSTAAQLGAALLIPGIGDLLRASIVSMTACGTDYCNAPPGASSAPARAAATAGVAAAVLLAAAALA
jgi:hypothetical protein